MAPTRTCIGCRERAADDELIRLVRSPDGEVVVDLRRRLPGRGAWVHPRATCLEASSRALSRAFRARTEAGDLVSLVRERLRHAASDGLSLAAAAGAIHGGRSAVQQLLADEAASHILVAVDASERARRQAAAMAGSVPMVQTWWTMADLGRLTGRRPRAMVAIRPVRASQHLRRQLRRLRQLG